MPEQATRERVGREDGIRTVKTKGAAKRSAAARKAAPTRARNG